MSISMNKVTNIFINKHCSALRVKRQVLVVDLPSQCWEGHTTFWEMLIQSAYFSIITTFISMLEAYHCEINFHSNGEICIE